MRHFNKDGLLQAAKDHIERVRLRISEALPEIRAQIKETQSKFYKLSAEKQMVAESVLKTLGQKTHDLGSLYPSPYFIKCILRFDTEVTDRIFYFSKLPFTEEYIYSWTTPAAVLRFTEPGKFSYQGGDGAIVTGTLTHKEQYLITDGRIVFMAAESTDTPRELIYQEHFSKRKTEFTLPEIVEQMEAAQDKAIRTPASRSLLISGPAGSGKTTLALHRIAYLLQAPDTAEHFSADKTLVLVNDHTTRQYFSALLPELGITDVTITTFNDFVMDKLGLYGYAYTNHGKLESSRQDLYQHQKHQVLNEPVPGYNPNTTDLLFSIYQGKLSPEARAYLGQQLEQRRLDRFDLTLLLTSYLKTHGSLKTLNTEYKQLKSGKVSRKSILVPIQYSLVLLDEIQNYLPKQIELIKTVLTPAGSMIYVGDLAQQTKLFTVRQWEQVGETFTDDNTVSLQKVYRSTKQILEYIRGAGYAVTTPENAREGAPATSHAYADNAELEQYIANIVTRNPKVTIGILGSQQQTMNQLAEQYLHYSKVKVLSISEAQGVEFDIVILCGLQALLTKDLGPYPADLREQVAQVNRDLAYVGLTRAMNELHILEQR